MECKVDGCMRMSCLRSQMVAAACGTAVPADGAELVLDNPLAELHPGDLLTIRFADGGTAHTTVGRGLTVRLASGAAPTRPFRLRPLGDFRYRMTALPDPADGAPPGVR